MTIEAGDLLTKAHRALDSARLLLSADDTNVATDDFLTAVAHMTKGDDAS